MLAVLLQDVRFGLRMLRRSPGFTAAAVLTLALGIGATTAGFSIVNAVLVRPLQFPESQRVMTVLKSSEEGKAFTPPEWTYVEWRNRQRSFDRFAGAMISRSILRRAGDVREVTTAQVSADFFDIAGAQPALGRVFSREEDQAGRESVALLEFGFWKREFGGDANVLGRSVTLDERPVTIIGVLPQSIRFPGFGARDLWVPLAAQPSIDGSGRGAILTIGRLRPGVSREAAQGEMDAIARQIARERTKYQTGAAVVTPLHEWLVGEARVTLLMLAGAVGLLLLIACANVANLVRARGTGRRREMAIRASLGAGRTRLAAQMITESVLLAVIGGAIGMMLALAAVRAVPAIEAIDVPRAEEISVDRAFLLIGLAISLASGVLFGLAPAWQAWRRDLITGLHGGDASAAGLGARGLRNALVAAQIALAMVLLSGAGLMTNTLVRLLNVDLGFARSNVLKIEPSLPYRRYNRDRKAEFLRELAERLRALAAVESVSAATSAPLHNAGGDYRLSYESGGAERKCAALGRDVDPGYFRTLGISVLAGRDFEPADASRKPVPVILNRSAVRALFGAEPPLGRTVKSDDRRIQAMQVVGVVGDVRLLGVTKDPGPQAYAPLMGGWGFPAVVIARTRAGSEIPAPAIRSMARSLDPESPPPKITNLDDVFSEEVAKPRFYTALLTLFAASGLILAAVGTFGVTAYAVGKRTHEFGVRLALGAEPGDIVRLMLRSGMRAVAVGALAGIAGALMATRLLASLLYGVKPRDPWTLSATAGLLAGVALLSCWLAARRAARVEPCAALRTA